MYNNSKPLSKIYHNRLPVNAIMHKNKLVYSLEYLDYITGTVPLTLPHSVGKPLLSYEIAGNTVQDGVPTPDNPVEIMGVGDFDESSGKYKIPILLRGNNLCPPLQKGIYLNFNTGLEIFNSNASASDYFEVDLSSDSARISISGLEKNYANCVFAYDSNFNFIGRSGTVTTDNRYFAKKAFINGSGTKEIDKIKYLRIFIDGSIDIPLKIMCYVYKYSSEIYPPYEPYHAPVIANIYINTPLTKDEILKSNGVISRADGTTEYFEAPEIPTHKGTNIIDVDTTVRPLDLAITYIAKK